MKKYNLTFILQTVLILSFTQNSFSNSSNNHITQTINKSNQRTLGVTKSFGRWPNGNIPIAYNPVGEPEYCDTESMINKFIKRILILPEVEVILENEKSIISNVVFELEPGSNPKKLKLRYSGSSN